MKILVELDCPDDAKGIQITCDSSNAPTIVSCKTVDGNQEPQLNDDVGDDFTADSRLDDNDFVADKFVPASTHDRVFPASTPDKHVSASTPNRVFSASTPNKLVPASTYDRVFPASTQDKPVPASTQDELLPASTQEDLDVDDLDWWNFVETRLAPNAPTFQGHFILGDVLKAKDQGSSDSVELDDLHLFSKLPEGTVEKHTEAISIFCSLKKSFSANLSKTALETHKIGGTRRGRKKKNLINSEEIQATEIDKTKIGTEKETAENLLGKEAVEMTALDTQSSEPVTRTENPENITEVIYVNSESSTVECGYCNQVFESEEMCKSHTLRIHKKLKPRRKRSAPKHTCDICNEHFTKVTEAQKHYKQVHNTGMYECDICQKRVSRLNDLKLHISTEHYNAEPFSCFTCDKTFKTAKKLRLHEYEHTGGFPFFCNICQRGFEAKAVFKIHVDSVHKQVKRYNCDVCGKGFYKMYGLKKHYQTMHQPKQSLCCHLCSATFTLETGLNKHIRVVHENNRPCKCTHCDKSFPFEHMLKRHISVKHTPHVCDVCGIDFFSEYRLSKHLHMAHDKPTYKQCSECDKTFYSDNTLKRHKALYHVQADKSFQCKECLKSFQSEQSLYAHKRRVHMLYPKRSIQKSGNTSVSKPHICILCSKVFKHSAQLYFHRVHEHSGKVSLYKCQMCGNQYKYATSLNNHIRSVHSDYRPFKCTLCKKGFHKKANYRMHVRHVHHKIKDYQCPTCFKMFSQKGDMRKHSLRVHQTTV